MATLTQRGKSWILSWVEGGRQQRRALGPVAAIPRKQAQAILHAKQLELSTAARLLPDLHRPAMPTVNEWAVDYVLWHEGKHPHSHARIRQIIEQHLLPEFGSLYLDAVDDATAERFMRLRRRAGAKDATVLKEFRTMMAMLNRAVDVDVIRRNPLSAVEAPRVLDSKPHRYYQTGELIRLYEATRIGRINGGDTNPEHGAWWKLFANTGMRRAEARHLRRNDIGHDGLRILSTTEERTKSAKWRDVPLSEGAREAIDAIPKRGERVLPEIALPSLSRACANDLERAGLDGSLHTLRHTYISHLVLAGVPLRTVQLYAGHSSIAVTEQYAYLMPDRAATAAVMLRL
jgi:integrase